MMKTIEAIKTRRTIRRFTQEPIPHETLLSLVDAARMAPSGSNQQPVRWFIADSQPLVEEIFNNVRWAAYIQPEGNPPQGLHPTAFIAMCWDSDIKKECEVDLGAAGMALLLAAHDSGIGACWMGAINKPAISSLIGLAEPVRLHTVFALGYPAESPVCEPQQGSNRYYKDENGVLHVPKLTLEEVLLSK